MSHQKNREAETLDTQMERTGILEARAREYISSTKQHLHGSNCKVVLVSPEHIPNIWDTVHRHLELMTPHSEGELEPEDFYEALTNAEMQLWVALDDGDIIASMVSQIIPYPRKQILRIIAIAGKGVEQWMQFLPMVEDWALSVGCTSLECWGRKGWLRVLKDWKCSYHIITKDLTARMH